MTEQELIERVKQIDTDEKAVPSWEGNLPELKGSILNGNVKNFIRYPTIQKTMFVGNGGYITKEYKHLTRSENWHTVWKKAIRDDSVGNPSPFILNVDTTGNIIHAAYHLVQMEELLKIDVTGIDQVFEFGGGYGTMCKLLYQACNIKNYMLYDFNILLALQEYYLSKYPFAGIDYTTDKNKILDYATEVGRNSLFVATWSFSESPAEMREFFIEIARRFKYILIAYQRVFDGFDNDEYFDKVGKDLDNFSIHNYVIKHMPANRYFIGVNYHE